MNQIKKEKNRKQMYDQIKKEKNSKQMYDQIKKEKNSKQMYDQIKKDKTLGEKKSPIFLNFVFKKILNKKIIILNTKCKSYFFWVSLLTMCIMTKLDGIIFRMWKNCKKSSFSHKNLISKNLDA